jgi:hypothetical protein
MGDVARPALSPRICAGLTEPWLGPFVGRCRSSRSDSALSVGTMHSEVDGLRDIPREWEGEAARRMAKMAQCPPASSFLEWQGEPRQSTLRQGAIWTGSKTAV